MSVKPVTTARTSCSPKDFASALNAQESAQLARLLAKLQSGLRERVRAEPDDDPEPTPKKRQR